MTKPRKPIDGYRIRIRETRTGEERELFMPRDADPKRDAYVRERLLSKHACHCDRETLFRRAGGVEPLTGDAAACGCMGNIGTYLYVWARLERAGQEPELLIDESALIGASSPFRIVDLRLDGTTKAPPAEASGDE